MQRRRFLSNCAKFGAGVFTLSSIGCVGISTGKKWGEGRTFKMKFAPRDGIFSKVVNGDKIERLNWLKRQGFTALEGIVGVNPEKRYSQQEVEMQIKIGEHAKKLGFEMGGCSAMNDRFNPIMTAERTKVGGREICGRTAIRDLLVGRMENTFAVLKRYGVDTFNIGAGTLAPDLAPEKQFENAAENLKFCSKYCAQRGFKLTIEPLNLKTHPNMFCATAKFGAKLIDAVDEPNIGLLYDVFHETMQVGNLDSLDDPFVWSRIAYFHFADSPTRKEPTTGNIDFVALCKKLRKKGWNGVIGLEHGLSQKGVAGELMALEIYRDIDEQI